MMNFILKEVRLAGVIGVSVLLSSCVSHLSKEQCQVMDWYQLGVKDGMDGEKQRDLNKDSVDCHKYGIKVPTTKYVSGWNKGVRSYCVSSTAYNLGAKGQYYADVCPSALEKNMQVAWHQGLRKYCIPSIGYELGRSGAQMPTFCATDLMPSFSASYEDGRRLFGEVSAKQNQVSSVDRRLRELSQQERHLSARILNLRNQMVSLSQHSRGEHNRQDRVRLRQKKQAIHFQINELQDQLEDNRDQQRRLRYRLDRLQDQLSRLNTEN